MADSLQDLQALAAGAVSDLVRRMNTIAAEIAAIENTDAPEYKQDLLSELTQINAALKEYGVNLSDLLTPEVKDEPYEIHVRGIV